MVAWQLSNPTRNFFNRFFGYDVFISYSRRQSSAYAASLQAELKKVGLACFIDQREIHPGAVLDSTIRGAIQRSGALVPIITKGTDQSFYVTNEIAEAIRAGKQIIPISVDDEIRSATWHQVQQYRWIDESVVAANTGVVSDGIPEEIRQTFIAMRRTQFRRLTIAGIALTVLAISAIAYASFRDARVQEAFGLYTKGLEAESRQDSHAAMMFFSKALTRNDSPEIRLALTSVLSGPRWRWDFQIPPALQDKAASSPSIAFTHGPSPALLIGHGHRLFVMDAMSGAVRRILSFPDELASVAVGGRGMVALGDATGRVMIFSDAALSKPRLASVDGPVTALTFNHDDSLVGVGIRGAGVRVLDTATGEEWYRSSTDLQDPSVASIAFAHKSSRMLFNMGRYLFAAEPVSQFFQMAGQQNHDINAIAWGPADDVAAVAGDDGPIQLINLGVAKGQPSIVLSTRRREKPDIQELPGQVAGVTTARFVGDGGTLASTSYDGTLDLWNTDGKGLRFSVAANESAIVDSAVSPDGTLMATVGNNLRVRVWNITNDFGLQLWNTRQLPDQTSFQAGLGGNNIESLAAVAGHLILGHANGSITLLDGPTSQSLLSLQQLLPRHGYLKASVDGGALLAVTPAFDSSRLDALESDPLRLLAKADGKWTNSAIKLDGKVVDAAWTDQPGEIAVATKGGKILFGTVSDDNFRQSRSISVEGKGKLQFIAAASTADTIAVSFDDGLIAVFLHGSWQDFYAEGPIYQLVLSPDGKFLTIITSGPQARMSVRDLASNRSSLEIHDWISDAAYDPSSQYMLSASDPGGKITLYNTASWKAIASWVAVSGGIKAATFASDGSKIYAAGNDGTVTSWPVAQIVEVEIASPDRLFTKADTSTGLEIDTDNRVSLKTAPEPRALPTEEPGLGSVASHPDIAKANAVMHAQRDEKDTLAQTCQVIGASDWRLATGNDITDFSVAAVCSDTNGEDQLARSAFDSFFLAFSKSGLNERSLAIWPGLDFGAETYLTRAARVRSADDLDRALQVISAEYQASWTARSLVRLPVKRLFDGFHTALSAASDNRQTNRIAAHADQLVARLGSSWPQEAPNSEEALAVSGLLFILATHREALSDNLGAWRDYDRAAEAAGAVVGRGVQSGDPDAPKTRKVWLQILVRAVSVACQIVKDSRDANLEDSQVATMHGITSKAASMVNSLSAQLDPGSDSIDEQTAQGIAALKKTLQQCPSLIPAQ